MCSEQTQRTGPLKVRQCKKEEENEKQISNRNKDNRFTPSQTDNHNKP